MIDQLPPRTISLLGLRVLAHAVTDYAGLDTEKKLAERDGLVEDDRGPIVVIRFDDMTAEMRCREEITILDVDAYTRRAVSAALDATSPAVLPAWGKHQRMGFTVLYGYLEPAGRGTARLTVPAVDGDSLHSPLPEEIHVVPMEGPAFFGFQRMTEDEVRSARSNQRKWHARTAPTMVSAEQLEAEDDQREEEYVAEYAAMAVLPKRAENYTNALPEPAAGLVVTWCYRNGTVFRGRWCVSRVDGDTIYLDDLSAGADDFTADRAWWAVANINAIENADGELVYEDIPF